jgi:hypothetical protein
MFPEIVSVLDWARLAVRLFPSEMQAETVLPMLPVQVIAARVEPLPSVRLLPVPVPEIV